MQTATWQKVIFHEELDKARNYGDMVCMAVIKYVRVQSQVTWICDGRSKVFRPVKNCECGQVPA